MNRLTLSPDGLVVVALDVADKREHFVCRNGAPVRVTAATVSEHVGAGKKVQFVIYPTATYGEGMGAKAAPVAPEDRAMMRALGPDAECWQVGEEGKAAPAAPSASPAFVSFDSEYLRRMGELFKSSMTVPNKQDYMWLATKTFGLNLAIRVFFFAKALKSGELPLLRGACSFAWYQLQDAVFTVFGQTYMKFLGKMTGMVRIRHAQVGDFAFVYIQLCAFEFLNRLVLGPLGENPLVYTPMGLGLIFVNILQGMLSGGPLIPAINQMRKVGVISHSTMMHLYQASSLTMQFGLFASFGYQKFYALLTGSVLVLSWGSYFVFTTFYKDPPMQHLQDSETLKKIQGMLGPDIRRP